MESKEKIEFYLYDQCWWWWGPYRDEECPSPEKRV